MSSQKHKIKKLQAILVGSGSLWFVPLLTLVSCGEQVIEDTRQVPGNSLKTGNTTEGSAAAQRVRKLESTSAPSVLSSATTEQGSTAGPSAEPEPTQSSGPNQTAEPSQTPTPSGSPDPTQSASPTPTATASPTPTASTSPTAKPAAWEPENIYRIVERNCMDACHLRTHSTQFKDKAIFLGAKSASLYRMTQTPDRPMPQAGTAPNFEPSGDKATLIEWLQQQ